MTGVQTLFVVLGIVLWIFAFFVYLRPVEESTGQREPLKLGSPKYNAELPADWRTPFVAGCVFLLIPFILGFGVSGSGVDEDPATPTVAAAAETTSAPTTSTSTSTSSTTTTVTPPVDTGATTVSVGQDTTSTSEDTVSETTEATEAPPFTMSVPVSLDYQEVADALFGGMIPTIVSFEPDPLVPGGTILSIVPSGGTEVSENDVVTMRVSTGPTSLTLDTIRSRGAIRIGVNTSGNTGLVPQEDGSFEGPQLDLLHAAFTKLLGHDASFEFVGVTAAERFTILASGAVDVMLNGTLSFGETASRIPVLYAIDGETQVAAVTEAAFANEFQLNIDRVVRER